jgi:hypothetical protein
VVTNRWWWTGCWESEYERIVSCILLTHALYLVIIGYGFRSLRLTCQA